MLPPIVRHPALQIGVIVIAVALTVWMNWPQPPRVDIPHLSRAELETLSDSDGDGRRLALHLSAMLLRGGVRMEPWQRLPAAVQPLWTTLDNELALEAVGIAGVQRPRPAHFPRYADAADGYQAFGCTELAALLREAHQAVADPQAPPSRAWMDGFDRRFQALLPSAQAARIDYLRQHLDLLAF